MPAMAGAQHLFKPVTVEELEKVLTAAQNTSEAKAARQISGLELTERMSNARLASWKTRLPGAKSWNALVVVADLSAFLDPPAAEIAADAPPDLDAQQRMMSKVIDYLKTTIPNLPNFIATQTTVHYAEYQQGDMLPENNDPPDWPLQKTGNSRATVLYRNGIDVVDVPSVNGKTPQVDQWSMNTEGTFGIILSTIIPNAMASHSIFAWSRWVKDTGGVRAVFRYAVSEANSSYEITFCCLPEGNGTNVFKLKPGYHGEIMIDPESGAILRITIEAELKPDLPVVQSEVMVEYGPVEIGGKTYICPSRSVSLSRGRILKPYLTILGTTRAYGPNMTMLNDITYEDYHIFRAKSRILTGDEPSTEGQRSDPGMTSVPATEPKTKP
ncbi:MAG: hypothetical protein ABSC77_11115 [Terracidiphilus sp.]|jgi:hypothetical protein